MRLYFKDTKMMYKEISDLMTKSFGPAGPDTWLNGCTTHTESVKNGRFGGYVEIYDTENPLATFVTLSWS